MKITKKGKWILGFAIIYSLLWGALSCTPVEKVEPTGCFIVTTTCKTANSYASGDKEYCGITETDIINTIKNTNICTSTYRRK